MLLSPKDLLCANPWSGVSISSLGASKQGQEQHEMSFCKNCIYRTQLKSPPFFFLYSIALFFSRRKQMYYFHLREQNLKPCSVFNTQHNKHTKAYQNIKGFGEMRHSNSLVWSQDYWNSQALSGCFFILLKFKGFYLVNQRSTLPNTNRKLKKWCNSCKSTTWKWFY